MSVLALVVIFFEKYAVPFLFVIGLLYFLYGVIEYFIIGKGGDEERSQHGRELFLQSIAWFTLSLILLAFVSLLTWISNLSFSTPRDSNVDGGADFDREERILPVPNVPTR